MCVGWGVWGQVGPGQVMRYAHIHTCARAHGGSGSGSVCVCMCVCAHARVCVCVHGWACMRACVRACLDPTPHGSHAHVHVHVHTHAHMSMYIRTHTYTCTCTCTCTHVHVHVVYIQWPMSCLHFEFLQVLWPDLASSTIRRAGCCSRSRPEVLPAAALVSPATTRVIALRRCAVQN